jgi:DNA ligase-4
VDEQKWIVRIILKDLKAGIGHETILKNYHPDALELFNATSDLRSVFEELQNLEDQARGGGAQLFRMFFPIKPMLAGKLSPQQIAELVRKDSKGVLVETKLDGERIQCHMQDGVVKFFTRNSNNYTRIYGPKISNYIKECVDA